MLTMCYRCQKQSGALHWYWTFEKLAMQCAQLAPLQVLQRPLLSAGCALVSLKEVTISSFGREMWHTTLNLSSLQQAKEVLSVQNLAHLIHPLHLLLIFVATKRWWPPASAELPTANLQMPSLQVHVKHQLQLGLLLHIACNWLKHLLRLV